MPFCDFQKGDTGVSLKRLKRKFKKVGFFELFIKTAFLNVLYTFAHIIVD